MTIRAGPPWPVAGGSSQAGMPLAALGMLLRPQPNAADSQAVARLAYDVGSEVGMANPEHVKIVKQGAKAIRAWRVEHEHERLDLSNADLSGAVLENPAYLFDYPGLSDANLRGADLRGADLRGSDLRGANLEGANLSGASLEGANLSGASLSGANVTSAFLFDADLSGANLSGTDLRGANLGRAKLGDAHLRHANVAGAVVGLTIWPSDLAEMRGLEDVDHDGPSYLSIQALAQSKGKIPEAFLRGCGLSDWEIVAARLYDPDLRPHEAAELTTRIYDLRMRGPIQISPLFISYSRADSDFVDAVVSKLDDAGIRYWRDTEHATAGRLDKQVTRAIALHPVVLLVLSENSGKSDWVEEEAATARELERELGRDVLCPVALDDAWETSDWARMLRRQIRKYNALDFSRWQEPEIFKTQFQKLIDGLGLYYKPPDADTEGGSR